MTTIQHEFMKKQETHFKQIKIIKQLLQVQSLSTYVWL